MLEIKNISKSFNQKTILEDLNLKVNDNELTVLLGASGCGKSTLLKIISGIVDQDYGEVLLDGKNISQLPINKRNTVIMFQDHNLFPHMNVFDNVAFALKMKKEKSDVIKTRVSELLHMVKLEEHASKFPAQLSGGQKQRVAIIRSLAVLPKVLLLDEPFSNLDIALRSEMQYLLKEIQRKTKVTTLMVTHDKSEAFFLADKLAVMIGHKIEQFGTPQQIYFSPTSKSVANFFGKVIYMEGNIKDNKFSSDVFNFTFENKNKITGKFFLLIRPENIVLDKNGISFKIIKKEFYGEKTLYELENKNIKLYMNGRFDLNEYDLVDVNFKSDSPVFFKL